MTDCAAQVKTVGEEKAAMEADPLFTEYMKKITDKGFFKGLEEGSKGKWVGLCVGVRGDGSGCVCLHVSEMALGVSGGGGSVCARG